MCAPASTPHPQHKLYRGFQRIRWKIIFIIPFIYICGHVPRIQIVGSARGRFWFAHGPSLQKPHRYVCCLSTVKKSSTIHSKTDEELKRKVRAIRVNVAKDAVRIPWSQCSHSRSAAYLFMIIDQIHQRGRSINACIQYNCCRLKFYVFS